MWDSQQEEVSLHDLLENEFFFRLDTTRYIVDERSYIHDTSTSTLSIASFVIIHPLHKGEKLNLRKVGFSDEFREHIDTVKTPKSEINTYMIYPDSIFFMRPYEKGDGYVTVGVPININIARRSLMKSLKLNLNETRLILSDTLFYQTLYQTHFIFIKEDRTSPLFFKK